MCVCWFFWKFSKLNESELKAIISVNVVGWNGVQYVCFCLIWLLLLHWDIIILNYFIEVIYGLHISLCSVLKEINIFFKFISTKGEPLPLFWSWLQQRVEIVGNFRRSLISQCVAYYETNQNQYYLFKWDLKQLLYIHCIVPFMTLTLLTILANIHFSTHKDIIDVTWNIPAGPAKCPSWIQNVPLLITHFNLQSLIS